METLGPCQKVLEILSYPKVLCMSINGPWHLVLSKMSIFRKCPRVQTVYNCYSYLWFTELIHKIYYHSFFVQYLYCGYIANNNPSCLSSLTGHGTWGEADWLVETHISMDSLDRTKHQGPFDTDPMSPWIFWTGPHVLQGFDHQLTDHLKVFLKTVFQTFFMVCPSQFKANASTRNIISLLDIICLFYLFHFFLTITQKPSSKVLKCFRCFGSQIKSFKEWQRLCWLSRHVFYRLIVEANKKGGW